MVFPGACALITLPVPAQVLVVALRSVAPRVCWRTYGVVNRLLRLFVLLEIRFRFMNKERYSFP